MAKALSSKFRLLPVTIAVAALAFGVHAGEIVRSAMASKAAPAKAGKMPATATPTRTEIELAEELATKRAGTDDRKRQIELRERLIEASEKRIDMKLAELKAAESQAVRGVNSRQTAANEQFLSLVKVYETMKPKDAARIFEKLDLSVQLAVATRMKERNMAALMAEMTPEAARNLTMEMAAQAQLSTASLTQAKDSGYAQRP